MEFAAFVAGALAAFAAVVLVLAAPSASASFTPEREARLQRVIEEFERDFDYPGLVVGVWQEGIGSFATAVGNPRPIANLETGRPVRLGDRFRIGSNTKTFTATLVLQLVQRGRLGLNDPVSRYVRGVPLGRLITIRMLLDHTSGIHNLAPWMVEKVFTQPHRNWRPRQVLRRSVSLPRYGLPGQRWVYSNTNYLLLGEIVRRITGQGVRKLLEHRVFDRLGMEDTDFRPRKPVPRPAANGYVSLRDALTDTRDWNLSWAWTAGAATSTLDDLRRWGPALATGRGVLNRRTQKRRLRVVPTGLAPGVNYGLGILQAPGGEFGSFFGHDGIVPGYDSFVLHSPQSKITLAALGNTSIEEFPVTPTPFGQDGLVFLLYPELVEALEETSGE